MDRRQPGPIKSVLLVITGWLVGWLVGNAVFSETALRTFLILCMKLGDYKGRKVTELDFWKKFLIWRYSQNQTLWYFSQIGFYWFGFWPEISTEYDLQFEWNLFFRKICSLEIFDLETVQKLPKLRFLVIASLVFIDFAPLVLLDFEHNDRWA